MRLLHVGDEPVLVARGAAGAAARAVRGPQRLRGRGRRGDRAHALRHRRRRRPAAVLRALPRRPGDRPRGALATRTLRVRRRAEPWEALAWCDHRAADRARAGAGDPAPADRRARPPLPATRAARLPDARPQSPPWRRRELAALRPRGPARDGAAPRRARGRRAAASTSPPRPTRWRRLRAIPTSARGRSRCSSLYGQGRNDRVPGRRPRLPQARRPAHAPGNPRARADEAEVRGFFERYGEWKGLAGEYLMHRRAARGLLTAASVVRGSEPLARQELVGQRARRARAAA